ncbi:Protease 2 [Porphyridium purpureum]|uniref:Prolyl endopeptidase n=1 Tax=Porphyridium purpureum TaxID=35688 RepID=A0A5J4YN48_PORPP|nr:Protease 2 [Porphyridium purpureum]|eukprot:POR3887..scf295_9
MKFAGGSQTRRGQFMRDASQVGCGFVEIASAFAAGSVFSYSSSSSSSSSTRATRSSTCVKPSRAYRMASKGRASGHDGHEHKQLLVAGAQREDELRSSSKNEDSFLGSALKIGAKSAAVALGALAVGLVVKASLNGVPDMVDKPPIAEKKPAQVLFGKVAGENRGESPMDPPRVRMDDYFWMRDDKRKDPKVIRHLQLENAYTKYATKHLEAERKALYEEMLSHVQETDESVPYRHGQYMYYHRNVKGLSYDINARKRVGSEAEEIVLDENELAKGLSHCDVRALEPSPDHTLVAYSLDNMGYETYKIYFKDLATGKLLNDRIDRDTTGSVTWGINNDVVFYTTQDEAHRSYKVWMHRLGTDCATDVELFAEPDEEFSATYFKSRSGKYLFVGSQSTDTSEWWYLDLSTVRPDQKPELVCMQARRDTIEYDPDHWNNERFLIVTNQDAAKNFKVMFCSIAAPSSAYWKDLFPYDPSIKVDGLSVFEDFIVMRGRQGGYRQLWFMNSKDPANTRYVLDLPEKAHVVGPGVNKEFTTSVFRFSYSSMTTPRQTWDYDVVSKARTLLKEQPVPHFDRSLYSSERLYAAAPDGTQVPMSMVYRTDKMKKGDASPLFLYGYGSYELSIDPSFDAKYLPLLDRGVIVVLAHVRGGGEQGYTWYDPGARYLTKANTFTDFIACAEHLIREKYTEPSKLAIEGRSAGGLLIGAVLNMRPDLFAVAIAGVPFVDVMNTMSDSTIPLTTGEWRAWGNPNSAEFYEYMLSYSPYDNIARQKYPSLLVTGGLYDPRVAFWEPSKWVAKLREYKTDSNPVLLKIDLDVGHFSASDRYRYLRERAFDLAFMLDQLGLVGKK